MVVWTWSGLEACLFWSCIVVIVFEVNVIRGILSFSPMGVGSADTVKHPRWRFTWTVHTYLQITQPGSCSVNTSVLIKECWTDSKLPLTFLPSVTPLPNHQKLMVIKEWRRKHRFSLFQLCIPCLAPFRMAVSSLGSPFSARLMFCFPFCKHEFMLRF